jgi:hypothetical protein
LVVVEGWVGRYPATFGAVGFLKFGPTAQPAKSSEAESRIKYVAQSL